jgi:hypothetical protein
MRRIPSLLLAAALAASLLASPAAQATAAPPSEPWAKATTTGDYIADSYPDVNPGHVFENVGTDRLLDILSSNGNWYLIFAGPEHPASQAALETVNAAAKTAGISKIYHFDPYLDGYQLDTTLANGIADVTGGTSVNFGGTAKISDVYRLITDLLPAATVAPGGALDGYAGDTALLLNVNIANRQNVETGKTVTKLLEVQDADAAAFAADTGGVQTTAAATLASAFAGQTASVRSAYQFFKRLYNASASYTEKSSPASSGRIGAAVEIFKDADWPNQAAFPLRPIDIEEVFNLLNAPGEKAILFAGAGCHNSQAIIGEVAKRAKQLGTTVYVVDLVLDSNVKFGTGTAIDTALANSPTGGLWIRTSAAATTAPYRYGYSYLYGKIAEYFGPNWLTENSSKRNSSVAYFYNGQLGADLTVSPYSDTYTPSLDKPDAIRLQVPALVRYNKASANPVVGTWLHQDRTLNGYTEYMLELAWVWKTAPAVADKSRIRDKLTRVEFAAEAVAALDNVLKPNTKVTHKFTATVAPTVDGTAKVGNTLEGFWGDWSHAPAFSYQWLRDGKAIPGATRDVYKVTISDVGKQLSFALTGKLAGYQTVTKISAKKAKVPTVAFTKAPAPKITGTAKVGKTLKAALGTWSPKTGTKFSYQWYANGKAIKAATKSSLKLAKAQKGKKITVKVTASKTGYKKTSKTSKATAKVKK